MILKKNQINVIGSLMDPSVEKSNQGRCKSHRPKQDFSNKFIHYIEKEGFFKPQFLNISKLYNLILKKYIKTFKYKKEINNFICQEEKIKD